MSHPCSLAVATSETKTEGAEPINLNSQCKIEKSHIGG